MTFGKVMGGGLPAAAFGGRADVMAHARSGRAGLPGGHPVRDPLACAAGLATLRACDDEVYDRVDASALIIGRAAADALAAAGVPHRLQRAGSLFSVFFTEDQVTDFEGAQKQNAAAYRAFFHAMLDQGIYLPPSAYEAWFLSAAHDDEALSRVADALPVAARPPPRLPNGAACPGRRRWEGDRDGQASVVDAGEAVGARGGIELVDVDDGTAVVVLDPPEVRDPGFGVAERLGLAIPVLGLGGDHLDDEVDLVGV